MFVLAALVKGRGAISGIVYLVCSSTGRTKGGSSDAKRLRPLSIGFHLREY